MIHACCLGAILRQLSANQCKTTATDKVATSPSTSEANTFAHIDTKISKQHEVLSSQDRSFAVMARRGMTMGPAQATPARAKVSQDCSETQQP